MKAVKFSFKTEAQWSLILLTLAPLLAVLLSVVIPALLQWLGAE